jgi:hypothetical protein
MHHLNNASPVHDKSITMARLCDESCSIPRRWATKLHLAMQKFLNKTTSENDNANLKKIKSCFGNFERCKRCIVDEYPKCSKPTLCTDTIKLLREVQPHYAGIRTFIRKIYSIRGIVRWFNEIDWAVRNGDWFAFNRLTQPKEVKKLPVTEADDEETPEVQKEVIVEHTDDYVKKTYGELLDVFKKSCIDFPRKECELCHEYCKKVKPMVDCSKMQKTEHVTVITEHMKMIGGSKLMVCCKCGIHLKNGMIPLYSKLNNIGFDEIPEEIRCLNSCELTLIKLARTFQTVVRLQPISKRGGPSSDHVQALKGLALHLPLPMQKTHAYVKSTLPSAENVTILVNSLPTKKKDVWQSVVNWEKVVRAVEYLKVCKFHSYCKTYNFL